MLAYDAAVRFYKRSAAVEGEPAVTRGQSRREVADEAAGQAELEKIARDIGLLEAELHHRKCGLRPPACTGSARSPRRRSKTPAARYATAVAQVYGSFRLEPPGPRWQPVKHPSGPEQLDVNPGECHASSTDGVDASPGSAATVNESETSPGRNKFANGGPAAAKRRIRERAREQRRKEAEAQRREQARVAARAKPHAVAASARLPSAPHRRNRLAVQGNASSRPRFQGAAPAHARSPAPPKSAPPPASTRHSRVSSVSTAVAVSVSVTR